jgi:CheY-like chemotaxis protein
MNSIEGVLLIDDDNINNFLNARLIRKIGITENVQIALNGAEALKYLQNEKEADRPCPPLILLDINMPVMNGFEFLDHFIDQNLCSGNTIVIMLTTSTNEKDIDAIKHYKMVAGYINKPLTEEKIKETLGKFF